MLHAIPPSAHSFKHACIHSSNYVRDPVPALVLFMMGVGKRGKEHSGSIKSLLAENRMASQEGLYSME
jgi:hypothetical protein